MGQKKSIRQKFCILPGLIVLLCAVNGSLAATPGLPFTEDFSATNLQAAAVTGADWSTALEELRIAPSRRAYGAFESGNISAASLPGGIDSSVGVALGDVDGDGDLDLVTANFNNQLNQLYLNDGTGTFGAPTAVTADAQPSHDAILKDMDLDGDLDLIIGNRESGGGQINRLYLNDGSGNFPVGQNITTDAFDTRDIFVADVNRDGYPDLLTANAGAGEVNKLYLNNQGPTVFATAGTGINITGEALESFGIAAGDLNGDGWPDIVCATRNGVNRYFLNDGTGNFPTGQNLTADVNFTLSIGLADMDSDGDLDVVTGNWGGSPGEVNRLYLNDGAGNFLVGQDITGDTNETFSSTFGDVDGDGDIDFIAGNQSNQRNRLYLNNGTDSPFAGVTAIDISMDQYVSYEMALGDLDGDGDLDLVSANYTAQPTRIYENQSSPNPFVVATPTPYGAGAGSTHSVLLADMDRDGDLDMIELNTSAEVNNYYENDGLGGFGPPFSITVDTQETEAATLGDVDGDGDLDMFVANNGQANQLFINDGVGLPFPTGGTGFTVGALLAEASTDIEFVDVDSDGDLDVVIANRSGQPNRLHRNDGLGNFDTGVALGADLDSSQSIAVGDLNRDGHPDIVVGNLFARNRYYLNNGTSDPFPVASNGILIGAESDKTEGLELADVDGDGDLDIVTANDGQRNRLYLNNGTAAPFGPTTPAVAVSLLAADTIDIKMIDIDHDGDLDLLEGNRFAANAVVLNNGTSTPFADLSTYAVGPGTDDTRLLSVGDIDLDGDLDIVAANRGAANVVLLNNGTAPSPLPFTGIVGRDISALDNDTRSMAYADFDLDGDLDLVAGNNAQGNIIYLNQGAGGYDAGLALGAVTRRTRAVVVGDVNGDGFPDIITGNNNQVNRLYLNDGVGHPFDTVSGVDIQDENQPTRALGLADFDLDGDLDLVVGNNNQKNQYYENDGVGNPFDAIEPKDLDSDARATRALVISDFNRDGLPDVIAGNRGEVNSLFLNDGSGFPFSDAPLDITTDANNTRSLAVADVDRDGDLDLVVGNENEVNRLYLNDGVGDPFDTVSGTDISTNSFASLSVVLADVNRDGRADVVVGNDGAMNYMVFNDGVGDPFDTYPPVPITEDVDSTYIVLVADLDRDGAFEIVAGNEAAPNRLYESRTYYLSRGVGGSLTVNSGAANVGDATLAVVQRIEPHTRIDYWLSNNGGAQYFQVQPNASFTFPTVGNDLRWRADLQSLTAASTPAVETLVLAEGGVAAQLSFTNLPFVVLESSGTATVEVVLNTVATTNISVDVVLSDNSATAGQDYVNVGGTLTWNVGQSGIMTLAIPILNDAFYEGTEGFVVSLTNVVNALLSTNTSEQVEIVEDDPLPTISFALASDSGAESLTAVSVDLLLSATSALPVDVSILDLGGAASGAGVDYVITNLFVTIPAGQTSQSFQIHVVDDAFFESTEDINLSLTNVVNAALGAGNTFSYLIVNDDARTEISHQKTVNHGGSVGPGDVLEFTIAVTNDTGAVHTNVEIQDILPSGLTYVPGSIQVDHYGLGETNTVADDFETQDFSGNTGSDVWSTDWIEIGEGNGPDAGRVRVVDAFVFRSLSIGGDEVDITGRGAYREADLSGAAFATMNFSINRAAFDPGGTVYLDLSSDGGTNWVRQLIIPLSGLDLGVLNFTGDISSYISPYFQVRVIGEGETGGDSSFNLVNIDIEYGGFGVMSVPGNPPPSILSGFTLQPGEGLIATLSATVDDPLLSPPGTLVNIATINSDQALGGPFFSSTTNVVRRLAVSDAAVIEGDSGTTNLAFTVALTPAHTNAVTVEYSTSSGSASSGVDYVPATAVSLVFAPGQTSQVVNVAVNGDGFSELDEALTLNLANAVGAAILDGSGLGTIVDDDVVEISAQGSVVFEGDSSTTNLPFTLALDGPSALPVTVDLQTADGTAFAGSDYVALPVTNLLFNPGETSLTVNVQVNGDLLEEPTEVLFLNLTNAVNATINTNFDSVAGAIVADDFVVPIESVELTGLKDAYIEEDDPTHNHGSEPEFVIFPDAGARHRALVEFDLSSIPLGSTITQANLFLYEDNRRSGQTVSVHRVLSPWLSDEVTWDDASTGTPWTPGGDFDVAVEGSFFPDQDKQYRVIDVSSLVQAWIAGVFPHHGFLIQSQGTDGEVKFGSFDNSRPARRPKLVLSYVPKVDLAVTSPYGTPSPGVGTNQFDHGTVVNASIAGSPFEAIPVDTRHELTGWIGTGNVPLAGLGSSNSFTLSESSTLDWTWNTQHWFAVSAPVDGSINQTSSWHDAGTVLSVTGTADPGYHFVAWNGTFPTSPSTNNPLSVTMDQAQSVSATFAETLVAFASLGTTNIEANTIVNLEVGLNAISAQTVEVDVLVAGGTASNGLDFTYTPLRLSFAPGVTSLFAAVNLVDDLLDEPGESILFELAAPSNANLGSMTNAVVVIQDDDAAPSLSIDNQADGEGAESATFQVSLSAPSGLSVSVNYATANGTANAGQDYVAGAGLVNFAPGEMVKTVDVTLIDDLVDEPNQTYFINLSGATNASIAVAQGSGTILDNDLPPSIVVTDRVVLESATNVVFDLSLDALSEFVVSLDATTTNLSASSGLDYLAVSSNLVFAAGITNLSFSVPLIDDVLDEALEMFRVLLSNPTNATLAQASVDASIIDDDVGPGISITDISGTELAGSLVFAVSLDAISAQPVQVDFATSNGTAVAGADYNATSGTLTFNPGVTNLTIPVILVDDPTDEIDETFFVDLANPGNGSIVDAQGVGTITDNDAGPGISISDAIGVESVGALDFVVSLDAISARTVQVDFAPSDGTAIRGFDYAGNAGSLIFAPGVTQKVVSVTIVEDPFDEPDQSFFIDLANPVNGSLTRVSGQGVVVDNDAPPDLNASSVTIGEGDGAAVFTLALSRPSEKVIQLLAETSDASAIAGSDYLSISNVVSFAPGEVSKVVTVPIIDDVNDEPSESFALGWRGAINVVLPGGSASGTILDNDAEPELSIGDIMVTESDGFADLPVSLTVPSGKSVAVDYLAYNSSAIKGTDFVHTAGTLVFPIGSDTELISVPLIDDAQFESNEVFFVVLSAPVDATLNPSRSIGRVSVADDDVGYGSLQINLSPHAAILEGARWRLAGATDTNWYRSGDVVTNLVQGPYTVEFSKVFALLTPPCRDVVVVFDKLTVADVPYVVKELSYIPGSDFYMDSKELTIAEYQVFADATGRSLPPQTFNAPDLPVGNLRWTDAQAYASWAGKLLPTEAEWVEAARGGSATAIYPWGNSSSTTNGTFARAIISTTAAGSYRANDFGLYDVGGNVWEWTADVFESTNRIIRGGSWATDEFSVRLENNNFQFFDAAFSDLGVRFITPYVVDADVDEDELPDAWEVLHFGHWEVVDSFGDYDRDGLMNGEEYLNGSDPTSKLENPRVIGLYRLLTGGCMIEWQSNPGEHYTIQWSDSMVVPVWTTEAVGVAASGVITALPVADDTAIRFFRIIRE